MCGDLKVLHGRFLTFLSSVSQTVVCKSPPVPEADKLLTFISFWDLLAGMCSDSRSLRRLLSAPPPSPASPSFFYSPLRSCSPGFEGKALLPLETLVCLDFHLLFCFCLGLFLPPRGPSMALRPFPFLPLINQSF